MAWKLAEYMGVWRATRCKEIFISQLEVTDIWSSESIWTIAVCPHFLLFLIRRYVYEQAPTSSLNGNHYYTKGTLPCTTAKPSFSIQFYPCHQRAFFRPTLPLPPEPSRPHSRYYFRELLQIPILPFRRSHHLHHNTITKASQPLSPRPYRRQKHYLHQPVRRDLSVAFGT